MAALGGSDGWLRFIVEEVSGRTTGFAWNTSPGLEVELASVLTTLAGLCMVAVLFGNIAAGTTRATTNSRLFRERLHDLKSILEHYHIPKDLYQRVKRHYYFVWACGSDTRQNILHDRYLTVDLRRQLAFSFYGAFLQTVPFLECQEEGFLKSLCEKVDVEYCSPMDAIIEEGESGTDLYFLVLGRVRIESRRKQMVFRTLEEGSFFGEMGLLFPESNVSVVTVVAETSGWMLVVSRAALEALCTPDLLQVLRNIALERLHSFAERHSEKSTEFLWPNCQGRTVATSGTMSWRVASHLWGVVPESSHPITGEGSHSSQLHSPSAKGARQHSRVDSKVSQDFSQAGRTSSFIGQVAGFRDRLRHRVSVKSAIPTTADSQTLELQPETHRDSGTSMHWYSWKASRRSSINVAHSPTASSPAPSPNHRDRRAHAQEEKRRKSEHAHTVPDTRDMGQRLLGIEMSVQTILLELNELNRSRGALGDGEHSEEFAHKQATLARLNPRD
eukprot:CAMPEP_0178381584 /NCGR_PEP_ID=MMETSP0689_2-20121128/6061_1 /TAXON_ID=160604 /ORGANISM="Amphidinium massartii, Strain CS-259" /LENGTH=501 /DNA_ID=CAMNT_0020001777 /DNA_START=81 /DNA_END=1583 /DNA_ORIENTATION=-